MCFPYSQVVVYSPKEHQTKQGLWKCFYTLARFSKVYFEIAFNKPTPIDLWIKIQKKTVERIGTDGESKIALGTINASSDPEERGETAAGQHADFQFLAVDEVSKVPGPVIQALIDTNSESMNSLMLISNGTRESGFFREIFRPTDDDGNFNNPYWQCIKWSAVDSPRVSKIKIQAMIDQYGEDSIEVQVGIYGEFPGINEWSFIQWDDCQKAFEDYDFQPREESLTIMGVDPNGGGNRDKFTIYIEKDKKCLHAEELSGDQKECVAKCVLRARDYKVDTIVVDGNGFGHGASQDLLQFENYHDFTVQVVMPQNVSRNRKKYDRVRDEMWLKLRNDLKEGHIDLSWFERPENQTLKEKLRRSLTTIRLKIDPRDSGRLKLESKNDFISRGEPSPDLADAIALVRRVDGELFIPYENNYSQKRLLRLENEDNHKDWMLY